MHGSVDDLRADPASFVEIDGTVFANGHDAYFAAWPDVVQLDAFSADLRDAVVETLRDIGDQCDGVRCDMAMLVMNETFERTWGARAGSRPPTTTGPRSSPPCTRPIPTSGSSRRRTRT